VDYIVFLYKNEQKTAMILWWSERRDAKNRLFRVSENQYAKNRAS